MRQALIILFASFVSAPAFAHGGHIHATSGHDHIIAYAAGIIAVAIAAGAFVKFKAKRDV